MILNPAKTLAMSSSTPERAVWRGGTTAEISRRPTYKEQNKRQNKQTKRNKEQTHTLFIHYWKNS